MDALEWPAMAHGTGVVATDGRRMNVRKEPISGEVLGTLANGERVIVWAALPNDWYLVQAEASGLTGYAFGEYIQLDSVLVREVQTE